MFIVSTIGGARKTDKNHMNLNLPKGDGDTGDVGSCKFE